MRPARSCWTRGDLAMLSRFGAAASFGDRISRRSLLQIGGLATLGLTLPDLLQAREAKRGKAKACIFLFLQGGPSHLDCWDPKPDGATEVRGEFQAIRTRVPRTLLRERLPRLAQLA